MQELGYAIVATNRRAYFHGLYGWQFDFARPGAMHDSPDGLAQMAELLGADVCRVVEADGQIWCEKVEAG
jgi:hypothetical protein